MMSGMSAYYISRAVLSTALSILLALTGLEWWMAVLMGIVVMGFFLWAPRSGRYSVHPEFGVTALRRDERTQIINDKAARNAFVVTMLVTAGTAIYFGSFAPTAVPIAILERTLILGVLTYFLSDFFLRQD
jgi:hypothetical protein